MVIIEDGCDEIMQGFMSGQSQEWDKQGFLFVNDDGEIEDPITKPASLDYPPIPDIGPAQING